jgi:hypothetical protein
MSLEVEAGLEAVSDQLKCLGHLIGRRKPNLQMKPFAESIGGKVMSYKSAKKYS